MDMSVAVGAERRSVDRNLVIAKQVAITSHHISFQLFFGWCTSDVGSDSAGPVLRWWGSRSTYR